MVINYHFHYSPSDKIWGGKSWVLRVEISFYGDISAGHKMQFATIKPMIYLPNDNFQDSHLHSNALLLVFPLKLPYFAPTASTASDVKPDVSQ